MCAGLRGQRGEKVFLKKWLGIQLSDKMPWAQSPVPNKTRSLEKTKTMKEIRILLLMWCSLKHYILKSIKMMKNKTLKGNVTTMSQKNPLSPHTLTSQPIHTTDIEWVRDTPE